MKLCHLFFGCLLFFSVPVWSQTWAEKGHKQYQNLAYSDAITSLEKAIENKKGTNQIYAELANAYYFTANYQASAKWYRMLFKKSENQPAIHFLRYAQTLKTIGKYSEAKTILSQMLANFPNESTRFSIAGANGSLARQVETERFSVQLANFNSAESDFGPSFFGDQIVFASTRDTSGIFTREHSWTNQSFTNLFVVGTDTTSPKPERFSKEINSKVNESSAVFTKDGLTMYFTRNNFQNKKRGIDNNQTTLLKIYKAEKVGNNWKVIGALPFCSDDFNTAHPALSPDEKVLYFASDRPGGFGQSDLYRVQIQQDGTFGNPENLGPAINTLGRETFPFVSQHHELYFASDAHEGFGGLDVFMATADENGLFSNPQNVGKPINSPMDDFGFILDTENGKGFFTSNRTGGMGNDDIYSFQELIPVTFENILEGTVAVANSEIPLENVEVILLDANANSIDKTTADKDGKYYFKIDERNNYSIQTVLEGYKSDRIDVQPKRNEPTIVEQIVLEKEKLQFHIGEDLAQKFALLPIYFDLSKSEIRPDAMVELLKIKNVLIEYPNLTIEVRSHTDSRDSHENNQKLSDRRAEATVKWLVENGIDEKRLSGVGFGETRLLNFCADNVECSEEAHQLNRRSEFIVTGL